MEILVGTELAKKVDYSFGDHSALWDDRLQGGMKLANADNDEFLKKAIEFRGKIMTLYIDNIRLYPRNVRTDREDDAKFVNYLMATNNLLGLCSLLPQNGFIIFTGQEDTPIDDKIQIPYNIVKIYAVNAYVDNERVFPLPFGVQRQISAEDNRLEVLKEMVEQDQQLVPKKLLYINCALERSHDRDYLPEFKKYDWATCHFDKDSKFFPYDAYRLFLREIQRHKFMICPRGHFDTLDCHRIWETLYMRRVPILHKHLYYDKLMKDFPALYVDDWSEITPELLEKNDHLYQQAQTMDMSKLDLEKIYASAIKLG